MGRVPGCGLKVRQLSGTHKRDPSYLTGDDHVSEEMYVTTMDTTSGVASPRVPPTPTSNVGNL